MNNILKKICEDKKLELEILKKKCSLNSLKKLISDQINKRDFKNVIIKSVEERKNFIIGEIKKASPSAGEMIHNYEPVEIAKIYSTKKSHEFINGILDTFLKKKILI